MNLLAIFLGGGLGSLSRYLTTLLLINHINYWTTFIINILGSILIGCISAILYHKIFFLSPTIKLFLITGFLGGFTTFSSFQLELFLLVQDGQYSQVFLYSFLSLVFGLLAISIGFYMIQYLFK